MLLTLAKPIVVCRMLQSMLPCTHLLEMLWIVTSLITTGVVYLFRSIDRPVSDEECHPMRYVHPLAWYQEASVPFTECLPLPENAGVPFWKPFHEPQKLFDDIWGDFLG
jgi:hypothetical protein